MPKVSLITIKSWFETYDKPTESQFSDTWDSFWHKDESIPVAKIQSFTNEVNSIIDNNTGIVRTTGNQIISGLKSFSSFPLLPSSNPTLSTQATNKLYVDSLINDLQNQINNINTAQIWVVKNW